MGMNIIRFELDYRFFEDDESAFPSNILFYIPNGNVENFGFRIVYKGSCRFY